MKLDSRRIAAAAAGLALQWALVALAILGLAPQRSGAFVLAVEAATTASTVLLWARGEDPARAFGKPSDWVAGFVLSALVTLLFAELDCAGTLRFDDGALRCPELRGGFAILPTVASALLCVACLPSALRAWWLAR